MQPGRFHVPTEQERRVSQALLLLAEQPRVSTAAWNYVLSSLARVCLMSSASPGWCKGSCGQVCHRAWAAPCFPALL